MEKIMKKPDLNALRHRVKRYNPVDTTFYKRFRKKFPQHNALTNRELRTIINAYNNKIWENVLEHRDGVELPEGLGYIFIGSCQESKKFNTNYGVSLKTNSVVGHKNFESDNFVAKIFYTNYANKYKFKNRDIWAFKGCRNFTRAVAQIYPENWKKYVQIDSKVMISNLFQKSIKKAKVLKKSVNIAEDYNEFDMN
jgi:hypothetical protein